MQVLEKNQLFVELDASEEASVRGGFVAPLLRTAIAIGGQYLFNVFRQQVVQWWLTQRGNGFIWADNKGTHQDGLRGGDISMDLPGNARSGIRINGTVYTI